MAEGQGFAYESICRRKARLITGPDGLVQQVALAWPCGKPILILTRCAEDGPDCSAKATGLKLAASLAGPLGCHPTAEANFHP
jgi:hypothetical protein